MDDKVEILMATYNGQHYVREQIASILKQSYPHIHLTIRDDASKDSTLKILLEEQQRFPDKITILPAEANKGLLHNFSELMSHSKASYIMLADQDDVWLEDKVLKSMTKMKALEKQHGKDLPLLVHTDLQVVDRYLNCIHPSFWTFALLNPKHGLKFGRLLTQNSITGCTILMNRPLLQKALPIPNDCMMHDWWLAIVAAAFGHIGYIPEATMLYRQHGKNDTGAKEYNFRRYGRQLWDTPRGVKIEGRQKRNKQVQTFYYRYKVQLTRKRTKTVEGFIKMQKSSLPMRFWLMQRHGLKLTGFLRYVDELI